MLDYLIVGLGLAGVSFCEQLEKNKKSYKVINDSSQVSSIVAGGLYNPVILKRFTMAWMANDQLELVAPFYKTLEQKLKERLHFKLPVLRRFASVEEQNLWFEACDKKGLGKFLSPEISKNTNPLIDAPLGYGEVKGTGRIDTATLLSSYREHLLSKSMLLQETFDFDMLKIETDHISYKGQNAKQIVFAEGFGLNRNPYFKYLPLTSTKGEYLTINAPLLKETRAIKSSIFLIPWEKDLYRVGATYKWKDTSNEPTEESRNELIQKLDKLFKGDYEIVDQVAGIRPTVTDRRPLVGQHPNYKNLYVLNGFGSRGVMIGPYAATQLFNFIEQKDAIHQEMDISRHTKKHFTQ